MLPFGLLRRLPGSERAWLGGLAAVFVCLAFLLLAVLNPAPDMQSVALVKVFFSASYVVLALWLGCGLTMLATSIARCETPGFAYSKGRLNLHSFLQ